MNYFLVQLSIADLLTAVLTIFPEIGKVVINADFARVARLTLRRVLANLQLEGMKRKREVRERENL